MFGKRTQTSSATISRTPRPTFDFGAGQVRASRHTNPDGSLGGWVADSAHVDATAVLGPDARVHGNARVFGTGRVEGAAQVYDNARVGDDALITGTARVCGNASVSDAEVSGGAIVKGRAHVSHGAVVTENAKVTGEGKVRAGRVAGHVVVKDRAWVTGAEIDGSLVVDGDTVLRAADAPSKVINLADEAEILDLTDAIDALAALSLDVSDDHHLAV